MDQGGKHVSPNILKGLLQGCINKKDLAAGREVHFLVRKSGLKLKAFLGNHLIRMFAVCGSLMEAKEVFEEICEPDLFSWSAIISAHANQGPTNETIRLYKQMQQSRMEPTKYIFVAVLKACARAASLAQGRHIHAQIIQSGLELETFVSNTLIDMYCKCGHLEDARLLFARLVMRDVVSWNAMIAGYAQHGWLNEALELFQCLQHEGRRPSNVTFVCVLKACSITGALDKGKLAHWHIRRSGSESDVFVGSSLVDMYVKCGCLENARDVFDKLGRRDVVTWSTVITGYAQHSQGHEALQFFQKMQQEGIEPNNVTFVGVLKACSTIPALNQGKLIHTYIIDLCLESVQCVANTLIYMYVQCGSLEDGWRVFEKVLVRDIVTWNAILTGYAQGGHGQEVLHLFVQMKEERVEPDQITFVSVLRACTIVAELDQGKLIHSHVIQGGFDLDAAVGNSLIGMYAKCGNLEGACRMFDKLPCRDVVTWTALIAAYAQYGEGQDALQLLQEMQQEGLKPDATNATFVNILKACSSARALDQGKLVHSYIVENYLETESSVGNALVDMYAKCGNLETAQEVLNCLPGQDVVTWNAIIAACAQLCDYRLVIQHFESMQQQGLKPDDVTFVSILSACGHSGLVDEGLQQFHSMKTHHGISPTLEHYNCMVDILGRAGCLEVAEDLLQAMPFSSDIVGWVSLLNSSKTYGNTKLVGHCFDCLVAMGQTYATTCTHTLTSDVDLWENVDTMHELNKRAVSWHSLDKTSFGKACYV